MRGPSTFHIHNYGVQLPFTCTTSLSGNSSAGYGVTLTISDLLCPGVYAYPDSLTVSAEKG